MNTEFGLISWRIECAEEVSVLAIVMRNLRRFMDGLCQ